MRAETSRSQRVGMVLNVRGSVSEGEPGGWEKGGFEGSEGRPAEGGVD
jgi:hypothetical protein